MPSHSLANLLLNSHLHEDLEKILPGLQIEEETLSNAAPLNSLPNSSSRGLEPFNEDDATDQKDSVFLAIAHLDDGPAKKEDRKTKRSGLSTKATHSLHLLSVKDTPGLHPTNEIYWKQRMNSLETWVEQPMENLLQDERQIQRKLTRNLGNDALVHLS